ncbi:30S ribosomal protein S17e [Candidatus Micrarchaeota archaeon]|nr:MAG: 30S ribosomal protein S17e [Candidatus Micrarchaeota archaeon]
MRILGKQRSKIITRAVRQLYEHLPDKFKADFEYNKKVMKEMNIFSESKVKRNIAAGYMARLIKKGPSVK